MTRPRLALALVATVVAVVAGLNWIRAQQPLRLTDSDVPELPFAATCQSPLAGDPPRLTSGVAVECPGPLDGRTVTFIGEVVGDVLERDAGVWVQLNDDPYGLDHGPLASNGVQAGTNSGVAVWIPDRVRPRLLPGRWDVRGTVLRVVGTFHRADDGDGGGTSVRARAAEVLVPGRRLAPAVEGGVLVTGVTVAVLGLGVWWRARARSR